jgi:hypothetical protein
LVFFFLSFPSGLYNPSFFLARRFAAPPWSNHALSEWKKASTTVSKNVCFGRPGYGINCAMAGRAEAAERLEEYLERLGAAIGHADRREPLRAYVTGLLLPGERKSVEPMAARIDPRHVRARHQSMHHLVANGPWDEREVLRRARDYALEPLERHAPVGAWVIDDTGIPKKGRMSVGVARQYCGQLGKQDNCQVVVTLSLVNAVMSVPAAYRLYLPEVWTKDIGGVARRASRRRLRFVRSGRLDSMRSISCWRTTCRVHRWSRMRGMGPRRSFVTD